MTGVAMATPDDPASPGHGGPAAVGDAWTRLRRDNDGEDAGPDALEPSRPPRQPARQPGTQLNRRRRRVVVLLVLWLAAGSAGALAGGIVAASQYKPVHGYRSTEVLLFDAVPEVV